nr:ABC transporter ATP-binding protein [uncultured Desulfobacter sp.]
MKKNLQKQTDILSFTAPYRGKLIVCVCELLLSSAANIAAYLVVANIFSKIFAGSTLTSDYILFTAGLVLIFMLIKNGCEYLGLDVSHVVAYSIIADIRKALAHKFLKIPMGSVRKRGHGEIKKNFVDNIEEMEMLLAHMIPEGIANIASLVVAVVALFVISYKMGLGLIGMVLIGVTAYALMFIKGVKKLKVYYASSKNMNNNIVHYINGMEVIKVFNQTATSYKKYSDSISDFKIYTKEWAKSSWKYTAVYKVIMTSPLLFVLPVGLSLYLGGQLSIHGLVLSAMLTLSMGGPLLRLISFVSSIAILREKATHITAILKEEELNESSNPKCPEYFDIDISDLCFAYTDKNVLEDIRLSFPPSTLTALVGESGAGKTTLARLLMRFWEYQAGDIKIGGVCLRDIPFDYLMQSISYVSQDNFLFRMSIEENIGMGKPDATKEEIILAAKAACCHDFIMATPQGYDTVVTASGATLSGGERQRITIARAIIKNAPIIILDEATSFTDPENEDKLQEGLNELIRGKTVIVIAHRLSTIVNANQIVVLENGKVHKTGRHTQLLENSEIYRQLWNAHENVSGWSIAVGGEAE